MILQNILSKSGLLLISLVVNSLYSSNEFVALFDGQTLNGWAGDPNFWRVEDGAIVGETGLASLSNQNTFLIWQGGKLDNFELKIEFKLQSGNSGVQYRSSLVSVEKWQLAGYQAEISDDIRYMGMACSEQYKGLLSQTGTKSVVGKSSDDSSVVAKVGDLEQIYAAIKPNDWNEYHIIVHDNQCIHKINGVTSTEFSENDSKRLMSGLIGLELQTVEATKVSFRNIRLKKTPKDSKKKVLFLAGKGSHGKNRHEHTAGCLLLARSINESNLNIVAQVVANDNWPESWQGYDQPDTIVMFCDGNNKHIASWHKEKIQALVDHGVGVVCIHFGVEVIPSKLGGEFLEWIGGYFKVGWSVNPHWDASFDTFPEHPITRGVQPFKIRDEWYYHMLFQADMAGVTPILSALPPLNSLTSRAKDKLRGSNPTVMAAVQAGQKQHVAWAYERPEGGRGFGFTGGCFHKNWRQDDYRKIVLNAILWTAQAKIPQGGVPSRTPSLEDLAINQDGR